jgi:hypothetical protein
MRRSTVLSLPLQLVFPGLTVAEGPGQGILKGEVSLYS